MGINSAPDSVQVRYDRVLQRGLPGTNADANPTYDESFVAGENVPYGVVISVAATRGDTIVAERGSSGQSAATAGTAVGVGTFETTLSVWTAITDGSFRIIIDGTDANITGNDFSSATDLAGVASVIQARIRANTGGGASFTAATVAYSATNQCLTITSGTTGASSSVSDTFPHSSGTGTDISSLMGTDVSINTPGAAAVAARAIGVSLRSVTDTSTLAASDTPFVEANDVGAYRVDGTILVTSVSGATDQDDVFYDNTTGEFYDTNDASRTQLGSSKWIGNVNPGEVGVIDIRGLR